MTGLTEYRIGKEIIYLGTGAAEFIHSNRTTGESRHFFGIITGIEDRGDYLYIGFIPNDFRVCRFGYFRLYKKANNNAVQWRVTMA